MSRIDDGGEERRAEEARAAERRFQERLQKDRKAQDTAFDRALAAKTSSSKRVEVAAQRDASEGFRRAIDRAEGEVTPAEEQGATPEEAQAPSGHSGGAKATAAAPGARTPAPRTGAQVPRFAPQARGSATARVPDRRVEAAARRVDAQTRRAELREEDEQRSELAGAARQRGEPVDREAGGGEGSDKGEQGRDDGRMAAFKLPLAALMAPPPLARPKGDAGAALRGETREIVEKIVRRVLVGANERGVPEFRLDLKTNILQGLSIRVSASRGKRIRAVFSGADRAVLASLEEGAQELKDALAARGLVLEELVFEEAKDR